MHKIREFVAWTERPQSDGLWTEMSSTEELWNENSRTRGSWAREMDRRMSLEDVESVSNGRHEFC